MAGEWLYSRLPIALQNLALRVYGRRVNRARYGRDFDRCAAEYQARSTVSRDEIVRWRDNRLASFVERVALSIPH
jgi:hypothetical protein